MAVTQRVDEVPARHERRDGLDQRWARLLEAWGIVAVPVPNALQEPGRWAHALGIAGLLLTGGNDLSLGEASPGAAPERDRTESLLLELACDARWPVLGVCRGMQMLNVHLGGRVHRVDGHVATRHVVRRTMAPSRWMGDMPAALHVNSFHGFAVAASDLADGLVPVFDDEQGNIEAIEHQALPWAGIMWHPERDASPSETDVALLKGLFRP